MSSVEKFSKTLEILKVQRQNSRTEVSISKQCEENQGLKSNQEGNYGFSATSAALLRSPKTVAILASNLSQQTQLMMKKETGLTSKEKLALCQQIPESFSLSSKLTSEEFQKLASTCIEILFLLYDDCDSNVRSNADEALNKVIRNTSDTNMGKILLEFFKEIKQKKFTKSFKAALIKFGFLSHHIRPQKCRAYVQTLLPHFHKTIKCQDDAIQEILAQAFKKTLSNLGYFINENEIRSLIHAFLPNLSSESAAIRRSAASCMVYLCQFSRRPKFFYLWLLDVILQLFVPLKTPEDSNTVLGFFQVLKLLAPHFQMLSVRNEKFTDQKLSAATRGQKGDDLYLSFENMIQVLEICLHYLEDENHNVVTSSLETLQILLQEPCAHLVIALTSHEGIKETKHFKFETKGLSSRTLSEISVCPSLLDESMDDILDVQVSTEEQGRDSVSTIARGLETPKTLKDKEFSEVLASRDEENRKTEKFIAKNIESSKTSPVEHPNLETRIRDVSEVDGEILLPVNRALFKNVQTDSNIQQNENVEQSKKSEQCSNVQEELNHDDDNMKSSFYSDLEIGTLTDDGDTFTLGLKDVDKSPTSTPDLNLDRRKSSGASRPQFSKSECPSELTSAPDDGDDDVNEYYCEMLKVKGNIGSLYDTESPIKYLVRYLTHSFLLPGLEGAVYNDRIVKISVKVLALNCIGSLISLMPSIFKEHLFFPENFSRNFDQFKKLAPKSGQKDFSRDSRQFQGGISVDEAKIQLLEDVLLYYHHKDPKIQSSVSILIGKFIKSLLRHNNGNFHEFQRPRLKLQSLISKLCDFLTNSSSICVRGAIFALKICLNEILLSSGSFSALPVLERFLHVVNDKYWLVKVDLCDLISSLNLRSIDFLEKNNLKIQNLTFSVRKVKFVSSYRVFSHRIIYRVFLPLLGDQDHRVRKAAAKGLASVAPYIFIGTDVVLNFVSGHLNESFMYIEDMLEHLNYDIERLGHFNNFGAVSRLVTVLSSTLMTCNEKHWRLGCLEALCCLEKVAPPVLTPHSWGCHLSLEGKSVSWNQHFGLPSLLFNMSTDAYHAADLTAQNYIIKLISSWLLGRISFVNAAGKGIYENSSEIPSLEVQSTTKSSSSVEPKAQSTPVSKIPQTTEKSSNSKAWNFLDSEKSLIVAEKLVQHLLRVLCIYAHVVECTIPTVRTTTAIAQATAAAASFSPLKKKSGDKSELSEKVPTVLDKEDEKWGKNKRSFIHIPEYARLYEVVRNAYNNVQTSLDDEVRLKFCSLLQGILNSLGNIFELSSVNEFWKLADEILHYLIIVFSVVPKDSVLCGTKLLKCLFSSNLSSNFPSKFDSKSEAKVATYNDVIFATPLSSLEHQLLAISSGQIDDPKSRNLAQLEAKKSNIATDKNWLSSFIKLFEPLVIKSLNLYTISSDITLQRSVLELLIQLVKIRVNYCLLDSQLKFIGCVINQFEMMEEGQIKETDKLLDSMFKFFTLLSYERHHSKNIIGVPKIIQLCDGLMASGQPPLSCSILALRVLVQDLFSKNRSGSSSVNNLSELETQKEVIFTMLLKLVHFYQVHKLFTIILKSFKKQNEKLRQISEQILDVLLPSLGSLKVNLNCRASQRCLGEMLTHMCSSVFQQTRQIIMTIFTSPGEIFSREGVERWVSMIFILLKVLIARCSSFSCVLECLSGMGISLQYGSVDYLRQEDQTKDKLGENNTYFKRGDKFEDENLTADKSQLRLQVVEDSDSSTFENPESDFKNQNIYESFSPKRFRSNLFKGFCEGSGDPLNVTSPSLDAHDAFACLTFEILKVSSSEVKNLIVTQDLQNLNQSKENFQIIKQIDQLELTSDNKIHENNQFPFLLTLTSDFILFIINLNREEDWEPVRDSLISIINRATPSVNEITKNLLYVVRWYPYLLLRWCQLLSEIDCASSELWVSVLRDKSVKTLSPHNRECSSEPGENSKLGKENEFQVSRASNSNSINDSKLVNSTLGDCISMDVLKRGGFLLFADFVTRHLHEDDFLTRILVHHVNDLVFFFDELQVKKLLDIVYESVPASSLLVQALNFRFCVAENIQFAPSVLSIAEGLHFAQSGALVLFLVQKVLILPFIRVSHQAAKVCLDRLNKIVRQSEEIMSLNDVDSLLKFMKTHSLHIKFLNIFDLLKKLSDNRSKNPESSMKASASNLPLNSNIDLHWFIEVIKKKCSKEGGIGSECAQLLCHLDYKDAVTILSSKHFDPRLLPTVLCSSMELASEASVNRCDSSSESEEESENDCDSFPLLKACKKVLLQKISRVADLMPTPHDIFNPVCDNLYSKELLNVFSNYSFVEVVTFLSPCVTELFRNNSSLPWPVENIPHTSTVLLRFCVLNLEFYHSQVKSGDFDSSVLIKCLKVVDAVLKHKQIFDLLLEFNSQSFLFSMVYSLHSIVVSSYTDSLFPSLPSSLNKSFNTFLNKAKSKYNVILTISRLMELILWLESEPNVILQILNPIRGIIIALGRVPLLNNFVRTPPEFWTLGWVPEIEFKEETKRVDSKMENECDLYSKENDENISAEEKFSKSFISAVYLPPFPPSLFQECDVLSQFIFRGNLFGFLDRQQFEETWMHWLSVLKEIPNEDTIPQEVPYINQSLTLAVRGVTCLLSQTLLKNPGNTQSSTFLFVSRENTPYFFSLSEGSRLQRAMYGLHAKLRQKQHLMCSYKRSLEKYRVGQLSVEFLSELVRPDCDSKGTGLCSRTAETRRQELKLKGLDVDSCIHFIRHLYFTWITPTTTLLCSNVLCEVVKSICVISDFFTEISHHTWVVETFIDLFNRHPSEDYLTIQYVIFGAIKSLAVVSDFADDLLQTNLVDEVLRMLELGLQHTHISVRMITLYASMYVLQTDKLPKFREKVANYVLKCKEGKGTEYDETHELALWEVWVYLVERHASSFDSTFTSNALHVALAIAAAPNTTPKVMNNVIKGIERLILTENVSISNVEVVIKLVMDLILNSSTYVSLTALPLFITALHANARLQKLSKITENEDIEKEISYPIDLSSDPEILMQFMEKISVLFDRVRICPPFEADVLQGVLASCLLDILPASQLLNKVIIEFISSHQPHPHLMASTVFQIFESAMKEGGPSLVQEWVLLSLSNFTQKSQENLGVWYLSCFFISASTNQWLRAVFPAIQNRVGKLESCDLNIFYLAAFHFRKSLNSDLQKRKFDDSFMNSSNLDSPFSRLMTFISRNVDN